MLAEINLPVTKKILEVRGFDKLISTYVEKMPKTVASDGKVHPTFKSIGASTGRFSSESPNAQNIPSHAGDIRHMFRATPKQIKLVDAAESESFIQVELESIDSIPTPEGTIKVSSITIGSKVSLLKDSKPATCIVTDIHDNTNTRTVFMKEIV